jgi:hypothetical protein
MLVVGKLILNNTSNINVRSLHIPKTVLARTKARDLDLSCQKLRIVPITAILECILDVINDLVSKLKVL